MLISLILPVYNEQLNIHPLYEKIVNIFEKEIGIDYEIIFVDDGSSDDSWSEIKNIFEKNKKIKGFKFTRNFGHQSALKAGLEFSRGDAVITMDSDFQHPPELIPALIEKWKEGYEIVSTLREQTKGISLLKELTSNLFYKFINLISDIQLKQGSSDFRLLDRRVVNEINQINEHQLFLRGLVAWLGFNSTEVTFHADQRYTGETKYTVKRMIAFAVDGIMSFSIRPLRIAAIAGILVSFFAFIYILYAIIVKLYLNVAIPGWTSVLISVLFVGGVQLLSIGLLGEYIGRLFVQSKCRKSYILDEVLK